MLRIGGNPAVLGRAMPVARLKEPAFRVYFAGGEAPEDKFSKGEPPPKPPAKVGIKERLKVAGTFGLVVGGALMPVGVTPVGLVILVSMALLAMLGVLFAPASVVQRVREFLERPGMGAKPPEKPPGSEPPVEGR